MTITDIADYRQRKEAGVDKGARCADLTRLISGLFGQIAEASAERRRLWHAANKTDGVTQDALAEQAGVAKQTVYMEIRRHKEQRQ